MEDSIARFFFIASDSMRCDEGFGGEGGIVGMRGRGARRWFTLVASRSVFPGASSASIACSWVGGIYGEGGGAGGGEGGGDDRMGIALFVFSFLTA